MAKLIDDHHIRVAFSIYENRGVYALLLGSGVSRAAEVPTGWEITLNLIRRLALLQGVKDQVDWDSWYQETTGKFPNYSEIVNELGLSPEERRSILHSYIEPTTEDRDKGRKVPTKAHHAIADMVRAGYLRVIITTNFDRLIESALYERGLEPTVVASVDALKGAEALTHTQCYVLKLHGDYKDARILNTDSELSDYPPEYNAVLDRIFDDHGLIVCGWSAEWDQALRAAITRSPARRYSVFWATHGTPHSNAAELIAHRGGNLVPITDADSFFETIRNHVETLTQTHKQNPRSVDLLVSSTKRYLSKPEFKIQLNDLLTSEAQSLLDKLESSSLPADGSVSTQEFPRHIAVYEAATEPLARMVGLLGCWGGEPELTYVIEILRSVQRHADLVRKGMIIWPNLRTYPAVLVFTAYGLGLVHSQRWAMLHNLFTAPIPRIAATKPQRMVDELFLGAWDGGNNNCWKECKGFNNSKTPLSDHLCDIFSDWGNSFLGIVSDSEELYQTWEILASLAYSEHHTLASSQAAISSPTQPNLESVPVGRSGPDFQTRHRIIERIENSNLKQALLEAGFGNGQPEFLSASVTNYQQFAKFLHW